jgi:hypothetical protein
MTPADRAELVEQAVDIVGRAALPALMELVDAYQTALDRETLAGYAVHAERLWRIARKMEKAFRQFPRELLMLANFDPRTLAPAYAGAQVARLVAMASDTAVAEVKNRNRGSRARWNMALACAALLDQHRPGAVSSTRSGPLHRLAALVHALATDDCTEAFLTGAVEGVGRRWRQRRLALAHVESLPVDHPDRALLMREVERLTIELESR